MANKKKNNNGRGPGGGRPDRPAETRKSQPTPKANAPRQKTQQRPTQKSGDRWSWYILYVGVAALILGAGFLVWNAISDQATGNASRADFDLPALFDEGDRVRLADLDDKPTVVNFFASWCINCERELPDFVQAASDFGDDVNFVFVHTQETNSGAGRAFARRFGLEGLTVASDVGASKDGLSRNHGARGLPMTVLYNADGTFQQPIRGELNYGQIESLLSESGYIGG